MGQRTDHRLLDPVDVFLDEVAGAAQIHQGIGHDLPRPVERDLPAAIGGDDRDRAGVAHMFGPPGQALREHRWVLAQPQLVLRGFAATRGERLHRLVSGQILHPSEERGLHR
jgi:hypothetical protein